MTVKQFLNYLEKIPVEREELLDMELKIKVPSADGVHTQYTAPREIHVIDSNAQGRDHDIEITTTFGV